MMSEDLEGVFSPENLVDDRPSGSIEFMGQKARFNFLSMTTKKDETRCYVTLLDPFDIKSLIMRDWTDINMMGMIVKKEDIISVKISSKALKLRFRRHTYAQG